jgi:hypothetical protein
MATEVSFGVVEDTLETLSKLVQKLVQIRPDKLAETTTEKIFRELVKEIISPSDSVRKFSHDTLNKVAKEMSVSVKDIVDKHKEVLAICPFKNLNKTAMFHKVGFGLWKI